MGTTVNILSKNQALLSKTDSGPPIRVSEYQSGWTTANAQYEVSSSNFIVDTRYVLIIYPESTGTITLTLPNIQLTRRENGRVLSANLRIKSNSSFNTESQLFIDDDNDVDGFYQSFSSGRYNALQTNRVVVPDDEEIHTATISVKITNHNSSNIFVTLPHLIHDLAFYENGFVGQIRNFLPDFYWELDSEAEAPTYPFFRLIDVLTSAAGAVLFERIHMEGVDKSRFETPEIQTETWGQSSLTSVPAVREEYIPWLAQFTGERMHRNFYNKDGVEYLDSQPLKRDFTEWQLSHSMYGRASGTRRAMIEAAQQVLLKTKDGQPSTKSVAVSQQYLGDPFAIKIETLTNETLDSDSQEESLSVIQSVALAKPMGYSVIHETVDEFFLTFDNLVTGRFDEFRFA